MMASARSVLPDPLAPTTATSSPARTLSERSFRTGMSTCRAWKNGAPGSYREKLIERCSTCKRGCPSSGAACTASGAASRSMPPSPLLHRLFSTESPAAVPKLSKKGETVEAAGADVAEADGADDAEVLVASTVEETVRQTISKSSTTASRARPGKTASHHAPAVR